MRKVFFLAAALSIMISQTGCFGAFGLTKEVYNWNNNISNDRIVKTLFFYVLNIIPVYGIAGFLDIFFFNVIEHWTGSNPMTMEEGEYEEQLITYEGQEFKVRATKNQMALSKMEDGKVVDMGVLKYDVSNQSWNLEKNGEVAELIKIEGQDLKFNTANGVERIDISNVDCIALKENYLDSNQALASK